MSKFNKLLRHDQEKLAEQLIQDENLLDSLMETLQSKTDDATRARDFLKSDYCTTEVATNILNHFAHLIVAGVNEPKPTMFDMFLMSKVAYTFGIIETCCFDKLYKGHYNK